MCNCALTVSSLLALHPAALRLQLMKMSFFSFPFKTQDFNLNFCHFFQTCLRRIHSPKVFRKLPPKAQQPRRATLCLVGLECSNTVCVCMHAFVAHLLAQTQISQVFLTVALQVSHPKRNCQWPLPVLLSKPAIKASPLHQGESANLGTLIKKKWNKLYF